MDLHRVSRRKFLAAGAAATTCSLLPSTVLGANQMVNMAAIGIGQRGGSITKAFGSNPNVNLVALCDVDIESTAPLAAKSKGQNDASFGWRNAAASPAATAAKFPTAKRYHDFRLEIAHIAGGDRQPVCFCGGRN
ncbi:MAG TPA: hypothetical protein DCR55_06890 [Lentisphaeria bacterium]|nr:hypothetical protein [Lentisphaeria bacterium]